MRLAPNISSYRRALRRAAPLGVAVACLIAVLLPGATARASSLDRFSQFLSGTQSARGEFEQKVLDKGGFHRPLWKRQAHVLARDDAGTYYFVDRLRDEEGGKGYRIFAGPAGGMKELPMTNVISDSVGQIYATKRGELRLITSNAEITWMKGGAKAALTRVPVEDNLALVYGDLGVYPGGLGTPCDDM